MVVSKKIAYRLELEVYIYELSGEIFTLINFYKDRTVTGFSNKLMFYC